MVRLYTFFLSFIQCLFSNLSFTEKMRQFSSKGYLTADGFLSMSFCRFTSTFQRVWLLGWILLLSSTTVSCLRTPMLLQYVVSTGITIHALTTQPIWILPNWWICILIDKLHQTLLLLFLFVHHAAVFISIHVESFTIHPLQQLVSKWSSRCFDQLLKGFIQKSSKPFLYFPNSTGLVKSIVTKLCGFSCQT